jgi:hypothetical protein
LLDADALGLGVVFHNQLLQIQKGTLVFNLLTDLDLSSPVMWRVSFFAIIALIIIDDIFYHDCLLNGCSGIDFFLHRDPHLESLRVRLGPNEGSIHQLDPLESFDLLQAKREEFWRFKFKMHPWRSQIPVALSAMREINGPGNSLSDIDFGLETVYASVLAFNNGDEHSAHAAPYPICLQLRWINIGIVLDFFCGLCRHALIFCDLNIHYFWLQRLWLE